MSAIVKEATEQKEYHDIDLLRQTSINLKEKLLEALIPSAIRPKNIIEENSINEDQIESMISEFDTYSFKHNLTFDKLIQSGYEALILAEMFGISVDRLPEYIAQANKTLDNLVDSTQKQLGKLRDARTEYDARIAELEEYKKQYLLIESNREHKRELDEKKEINKRYHERIINGLEKDLAKANQQVLRLEGENLGLDSRSEMFADKLDRLDKLKKEKHEENINE